MKNYIDIAHILSMKKLILSIKKSIPEASRPSSYIWRDTMDGIVHTKSYIGWYIRCILIFHTSLNI